MFLVDQGEISGLIRHLLEALEVARAVLDRPDDDERRWSGVGWFDRSKLSGYEGGDLVRMGRYVDALPVLDAALSGLSPTMRRHRCTALVDRAEALAASGDVDQACADAAQALDIVAEVQHAETLRRITGLARRVRPARTQATRALGEQLSTVKAAAWSGA
jgi:tetratricopeptide (TPR) repeat protein